MAKYKQKLIDKVLFYDLQPNNRGAANVAGGKPNDKNSKKCNPKGVVKQR